MPQLLDLKMPSVAFLFLWGLTASTSVRKYDPSSYHSRAYIPFSFPQPMKGFMSLWKYFSRSCSSQDLFLSDPTFSHILRLLENKFPGNFIGYHWIQCCYIPFWGNKAQSQLTVYFSREKGKRKKCIFKCKLTSQNIIQSYLENKYLKN